MSQTVNLANQRQNQKYHGSSGPGLPAFGGNNAGSSLNPDPKKGSNIVDLIPAAKRIASGGYITTALYLAKYVERDTILYKDVWSMSESKAWWQRIWTRTTQRC